MIFSINQALLQVESGKDDYWMLASRVIGKKLAGGLSDHQIDVWADRCMIWYDEQSEFCHKLKIAALLKVLATHDLIDPPRGLSSILDSIPN